MKQVNILCMQQFPCENTEVDKSNELYVFIFTIKRYLILSMLNSQQLTSVSVQKKEVSIK